MTRIMIAVLALAASVPAAAGPYIRPLDLSSPHFIAGAYLDPETPGASEAGTAIALLTHATEDGCGLPSIVCTDWTPLAVGVVANGGKFKLAIGPVFNLAPVLKSLALKGLNAVTEGDSFRNVKETLGSVPITGPDATVSIGPSFVYSPQENKGYFRKFFGGELGIGKKK